MTTTDPMKSLLVIVLATAMVASCATQSSVPIPAGENIWILTRQEGGFLYGSEPLLEETMAESRLFCSNMGKSFKLVDTYQNEGEYTFSNFPEVTITFSCLDADENVDE